MPPFRYRTVQDPYVGDITRLMGAGPEAEARSIREVGNIRAQEAQQKGAITAGLVGDLSDIGQSAYGTYRQNKIDKLVAEVAYRKNPAASAYVGEDRVRPMDWNALSPAMIDTPVPQDRPPGKKAYTPPSADTPLPMPDRETEPFAGRLEEMVGPTDTGERFFMTPARNVIPDASVEEPDEALQLDMVRPDGTRKGEGYFGPMRHSDGRWSTEISIADSDNPLLINEDGSRMDYPALVPTLTQEEITWLLAQPADGPWRSDPRGQAIAQKAEAHAIQRREAGLSVFSTPEDALTEMVSIGDPGRFSEIVPEQADRGKMFSMTPAQPFRDSTEAKLPAEKAAPAPETMGEMLAPTVVPTVPQDRGEPPSLWLNQTKEGVFKIKQIAEQLQREGLTRAEIYKEVARLNEYNTAQIALNNREKELGLDARTLRVDRSLGSLFVQNPNPSFNEIMVAVEGDTEQALDIQKTMAEGQKAILDISNGQVENLVPKVQAMLALIDVFPTPSSQQAALDLAKGELVASGQVPKELLPLFEQLQTTDDFRKFVGNLAAQEDQGSLDEQISQKMSERQYAQSIGDTETVNQLDAEIAELRELRTGLEQDTWRPWRPYASSGGSGGGTSVITDEAFAERVAALGIEPPMGKNMYETLQGYAGFFQSTGMPAALARTARSTFLIGDVMAGIPGFGTWGDRALEVKAQFLQAENEIMRRVVKNPRFPEAEQQRILEMINLSFGPLTSRGGPMAGLKELTRTLKQIQITRLAHWRTTGDEEGLLAAEDIDRLLDYLGVPDHVVSGEQAPIPVSSWEADGKRMYYDKDENLIEHLTEALE